MKFVLVDQITSLTPGESITGVKNLSLAEEYLGDHFPGFPVMPGVMMLEALTQISAWLWRITNDFEYSTILLHEAKAVKFNNFLTPGNTLDLTATHTKSSGNTATFKASGTVDGVNTLSAKLTLVQFNLAETNPEMSAADDTQRAHWKSLYSQLWKPTAPAES